MCFPWNLPKNTYFFFPYHCPIRWKPNSRPMLGWHPCIQLELHFAFLRMHQPFQRILAHVFRLSGLHASLWVRKTTKAIFIHDFHCRFFAWLEGWSRHNLWRLPPTVRIWHWLVTIRANANNCCRPIFGGFLNRNCRCCFGVSQGWCSTSWCRAGCTACRCGWGCWSWTCAADGRALNCGWKCC